MSAVKTNNFKGRMETGIALKSGLWLIISLMLSVIFFRDFWTGLISMLSPEWIVGQYHTSLWGVLLLCLLVLILKRKEIYRDMHGKTRLSYILPGIALVGLAVLIPTYPDLLIFQVLMAGLGVFVILFGKAAKIPSILLAIYCFAIIFPLAVERFAQNAYAQSALVPAMKIMTGSGYPIINDGQWVFFTSGGGEPISILISSDCAGPATMSVFIALFTLMMLDMTLPPKKAAILFLIGVVGTWIQNIIRLVILMLAGYHWGGNALWSAHTWTVYLLFPLWYLLFSYIYFRQVGWLSAINKKKEPVD